MSTLVGILGITCVVILIAWALYAGWDLTRDKE